MALLADPHRTALSLFTILGACPVPFDTEATPSPHPNASSSQEASCLMARGREGGSRAFAATMHVYTPHE